MNKYEEAAREYWLKMHPTYIEIYQDDGIQYLMTAFRWYDERREKETCEWERLASLPFEWRTGCCSGRHIEKGNRCPDCGRRIIEMSNRENETCETPSHIGYHRSWWKYCPVCGRRIVEKEGTKLDVVSPVSQTGSSKKSTLTTPDE